MSEPTPIHPIRQRLIDDMTLRGFAPLTQKSYIRVVRNCLAHAHKSPKDLQVDDARAGFQHDGREFHGYFGRRGQEHDSHTLGANRLSGTVNPRRTAIGSRTRTVLRVGAVLHEHGLGVRMAVEDLDQFSA